MPPERVLSNVSYVTISQAVGTILQVTHSQILEVALKEVRQPELAATKQFLSVHELAEQNQLEFFKETPPDFPGHSKQWSAFFNLKHVFYFWLVHFENREDRLIPKACHASEFVKLYPVTGSEETAVREIKDVLGLKATGIRVKGQPITTRPLPIAKEHHYYPNVPKPYDFEEKLGSV